ncbi:hypothetical protein ACFL2Q_09365 [Thermodesulfobacteriota bacterium]
MAKHAVSILLILTLGISVLVACGTPLGNEDLYVGFCSGRDTLAGKLGEPNDWAFTTEGKVWVDQSWLSHLIYYVTFLALGEAGPVLTKVFLLLACLATLFFRCRALSIPLNHTLIALTAGTLALAPFLGIRAQNFGMLYFVLLGSMLTLPHSWGRLRQVGALVVLAVWSNSHGSFMFGFFLLILKFLTELVYHLDWLKFLHPTAGGEGLDDARTSDEDREDGSRPRQTSSQHGSADPIGWGATVALAVPVIAFLNPYGAENLLMPFRQLLTPAITTQWVDWRPLFHVQSISLRGLFDPLSVLPFLAVLAVVAMLSVGGLYRHGFRAAVSAILLRAGSSRALVECLIPVVLFPLVVKYQRMIVFEALALIPPLALLIQANLPEAGDRGQRSGGLTDSRSSDLAVTGAAFLWLILPVIIFRTWTLPYYLPNNPLTPLKRPVPLFSQLMNSDMAWQDVARFLKENDVRESVFARVVMSNYLLYHNPGLRFFFDLRAQSAYPHDIIKDYLTVMNSGPQATAPVLETLRKHKISLLILDTRDSKYFDLAARLMASKEWGCIYKDRWVFVLARSDDERFGPFVKSGRLDALKYPTSGTRAVSQAILELFREGSIGRNRVRSLIAAVRDTPDPNVYSLIISALNGSSGCLKPHTKAFLRGELTRLTASDYMTHGGVATIVASALRILDVLEQNSRRCEGGKDLDKYAELGDRFRAELNRIYRLYSGSITLK